MDEMNSILILTDEEGNEIPFEFLDTIEYEGEEYVVLYPADEDGECVEVTILRIEESDKEDEEEYVSVDDEITLNAVYEIFKEKFKDQLNFVE